MPDHSRWMIKAGIIWLVISVGMGLLGTVAEAGYFNWLDANFRMAVWHTLTVGWLTQLIFGVSLWMFPGVRKRSRQKDAQSNVEWIIFGLLNFGVALRLITQPNSMEEGVALAGLAQWSAMILYAVRVWPSTKSKRVRSRSKKG